MIVFGIRVRSKVRKPSDEIPGRKEGCRSSSGGEEGSPHLWWRTRTVGREEEKRFLPS